MIKQTITLKPGDTLYLNGALIKMLGQKSNSSEKFTFEVERPKDWSLSKKICQISQIQKTCKNKIRYLTKAEAKDLAFQYNQRAYKCPFCKAFHLASK